MAAETLKALENIVRELKEQCSVGCLYCTVTVESDGCEHHEAECLIEKLTKIHAALALCESPSR